MRDIVRCYKGDYFVLLTRYINQNLYTVTVFKGDSKGEITDNKYINRYEATSYRDARNYVKTFKQKWE